MPRRSADRSNNTMIAIGTKLTPSTKRHAPTFRDRDTCLSERTDTISKKNIANNPTSYFRTVTPAVQKPSGSVAGVQRKLWQHTSLRVGARILCAGYSIRSRAVVCRTPSPSRCSYRPQSGHAVYSSENPRELANE
jgi:hypothetical protein